MVDVCVCVCVCERERETVCICNVSSKTEPGDLQAASSAVAVAELQAR